MPGGTLRERWLVRDATSLFATCLRKRFAIALKEGLICSRVYTWVQSLKKRSHLRELLTADCKSVRYSLFAVLHSAASRCSYLPETEFLALVQDLRGCTLSLDTKEPSQHSDVIKSRKGRKSRIYQTRKSRKSRYI
jgi:hypothetical protein